MSIHDLQNFLEANCSDACQSVDLKDLSNGKTGGTTVLVVDVSSCSRYFYGPNIDWVCGGQWNQMLRNVEHFVRSFRQLGIEPVAFFDGEVNSMKLHEWRKVEDGNRRQAYQALAHVMRNATYPSKKMFFSPPVLSSCLRLAFRSCGVSVCVSLGDLHKEVLSFCRKQNLLGIVGNHADYVLLNAPRYFSAEKLKIEKRSITTVSFDIEKIFEELQLHHNQVGLFASLLGNPLIPEEHLSMFHWSLLGPEHPVSKLQGQVGKQSIFPPNEAVIKSVLNYVKNLADTSNYAWIAKQAFQSDDVNLDEMTERLIQSAEHYSRSTASAPDYSTQGVTGKEVSANQVHGAYDVKPLRRGNNEHQYQKLWQHWQQHQLIATPVAQQPAKNEESPDSLSSDEKPPSEVKQLQETMGQLELEDVDLPIITQETEQNGDETEEIKELASPVALLPTPPPSEEASPVEEKQAAQEEQQVLDELMPVKGLSPSIAPEVLEVARRRHSSGQMMKMVFQTLTKGEIMIGTTLEDEHSKTRPVTALLYRPIRQRVYGILFDKKAYDKSCQPGRTPRDPPPVVKEWCVYGGKKLDQPDLVEPVSLEWDIPQLKQLWFGTQQIDNKNRLKAFLSCMQSDTPSITDTILVPQRLIIFCCVLRYLLQQQHARAILHPRELDAFLATALSPQLTTECNASNLGQIKLTRVELRAVQLAATFMRGVEAAEFANDACGSPVPWELVCPWNFFDGKLFHSKLLLAISDVSLVELCDRKAGRVEKLERLKWCITEGLHLDFMGSCLPPSPMGFLPTPGMGLLPTPFMRPPGPTFQSGFMPGANFLPAGARIPQMVPQHDMYKPRGRGPNSKRLVSGLGGTLEVAGMPVAKWSGNKAGRGYTERSRIIVGGPTSVEMGGRGRGMRGRRGRGGARNVSWAVEIDKDYDRSIGYKENRGPKNRTTNISKVREGGDGGNEQGHVIRGRGDGGSDVETLQSDHMMAGPMSVHPIPGGNHRPHPEQPHSGPMHPGQMHPNQAPTGPPHQGMLQQDYTNTIPHSMVPLSQVQPQAPLPEQNMFQPPQNILPGVEHNGNSYTTAVPGPVPPMTTTAGLESTDMMLPPMAMATTPSILNKNADKMAALGRGRGIPMTTNELLGPALQDGLGDSGGKGRGWWWEKAKQQQPPPS